LPLGRLDISAYIFRLLVEQGPEGLTPGAIAEKLELAAPTLSFHLKELSNSGLITSEQDGRFIVYAADFSAMRELVEFLYHNCCGVGVEGCDFECVPAIKPQGRAIQGKSLEKQEMRCFFRCKTVKE
jgi:ArsR family transcriptional regulator